MIQATVKDLLQGKLDHITLTGVYLIREGESVLYVGRSIDVVDRLHNHIKSWASSAIGDTIRMNFPQSLKWQIELVEPEECREMLIQQGSIAFKDPAYQLDEKAAELGMIRHHHPCINTSNNPNPSALPEHIKCGWRGLEVGLTDNLF